MDPTLLGHVLDTVSDLVPAPGTAAGDLDKARAAVARAAATGQSAGFFARSPALARAAADTATHQALSRTLSRALRAKAAPERIVRRSEPTATSASPVLFAARSAGRAVAKTFGPFVDAFGRATWLDIFAVTHLVGIQRQGGAAPFAYVHVVGAPAPGAALKLRAGSVWFAANALAGGAPAGGFAGVRIKGGTVTFDAAVALDAEPIVVAASAKVTFALTLDSPAPASGTGGGDDARQADVRVPAHATFAFAPGGATIEHLDDASLTAFGTALQLRYAGAPFFYDAFQNRVAVPCGTDVHAFTASDSRSPLMTLTGTAPVVAAAWSLPIAIVAASDLGPAAGAGGVALALGAGLAMTWHGHDGSAACGPVELVAEPSSLRVASLVARAPDIAQSVRLWDAGGTERGVASLRFPKPFAFTFVSETAGIDAFSFLAPLTASFDRPRTINNARVRFESAVALVELFLNALGTFVVIEALTSQRERTTQSYALKNLLLNASDPLGLLVAGVAGADGVVSGLLALQSTLHFALPILPDPYAANIGLPSQQRLREASLGTMSIVVRWQPADVPALDVVLPPNALALVNRLAKPPAAPMTPQARFVAKQSGDQQLIGSLGARFQKVAPLSDNAVSLLDVSTNVSLFGVTLDTASPSSPLLARAPGPALPAPAVRDLALEVTGLGVHVMTLPAVQYEPVLTPDPSKTKPPFPSRLTFADTGGATIFATDSVALVPVAPRPALDAILAHYHAAAQPNRVAIRFTLPFGIAAVAELDPSSLAGVASPTLNLVAPHFASAGLTGGDQLSVRAAEQLVVKPGGTSPSLPGVAVQLHDAQSAGVPVITTVLTPIDKTFNTTFGPKAPQPRVPVTRIDFSGFGESTFSDWNDPAAPIAQISKAYFHVMVGRTALEVVQAYSILYPYAVRVVRTITIERTSGAAIVRHDSGWQPVSDGFYRFPETGLVVHPGIVHGVTHVGNIRDTGQTYTTDAPDAIDLMAVRFDCDVQIENAREGAGLNGVPARDQLGYVQLTPGKGHSQLTAAQYAKLLADVGALGGPVDCVVDVGGSGERMRVGRVDVGATTSPGAPNFAMAAWGSPQFPGGGQWSFVRQTTGDSTPQPVDRARGVPLVREGPATAAPAKSPYRFADPADLLAAAKPAADYGILHGTGTQRTLFPRPKIEASARAFTSILPPLIADPYALATATGLFPKTDACIPFPDAKYSLDLGAGGHIKLTRATASFTTPLLKRILHESDAVRTIAYCNDDSKPPKPSVVKLAIDTAAALPWSLAIDGLSVATESGSHGEISRVVGNMVSDAATRTALAASKFVFGDALKDLKKLISFLENFGDIGPVHVSMTDAFSVTAELKLDLRDLLELLGPAGEAVRLIVDVLDFTVLAHIAPTAASARAQFDLVVKVPTPFDPVVAIGTSRLAITIDSASGLALAFELGVGVGVDFLIGPFEIEAYYAQTQFLIFGDKVFGIGAGALIKGTVDLVVASITVCVEAKMALLRAECPKGSAIWGVAQVTFALELSIAFIIDIDFHEKAQLAHNLDGGTCTLADVVP